MTYWWKSRHDFEPAISALTGLHVRPLHHTSVSRREGTMAPNALSSKNARQRAVSGTSAINWRST